MAKRKRPWEIVEEKVEKWKREPTEFLILSSLGLPTFPASIRHLRDLEFLDIEQNRLTEIPSWIGELRNLKGLGLSANRLVSLPHEIGSLSQLRYLRLQQNDLSSLPRSLQELPLETLQLDGNPLLQLPISILRRPAPEILRYYFESREAARPLLELKLLLVGRGKAGKTTLVKRLAGEQPEDNEPETHSISIRELPIECQRGIVRTRAWDFGGQDILHSTHQFFLTERSLYVVVLEPRTNLAQRDAEYWLKLIETQGAGSPAVVVLNWSHGRRWRIDEVKLLRKFPFIVDFISTDALHGDGIDDLRDAVVETVEERMPDVWVPFPKKWREIKDAVAGMSENFLSYPDYVKLCETYGETRDDAQADLAGILNALGLALYFGRDQRLHDTRVLNPSWVTGGVYAVIRSQSVAQNDGQLAEGDMPRVLQEAEAEKVIRAADYPPNTHGFILELMRAFQLCYASEEEKGKPTRFLVPELLSEFEPSMNEDWDNADVRLRYRYELLPPGLLPRFIVRTHSLSDGSPHWRHGVVLRHADAKALIREESDRPELQVFVLGGDAETRQLLVSMIRRELESLHAEMKMQPIEDLELTGEAQHWIGVKALREVAEPDKRIQKLVVQPEGTADVDVPRELVKLVPLVIESEPRAKLFVSYAHEDERQLGRLDKILDVLEQQQGLASWTDRRLVAGDEWDKEIRRRLEEMDIFLFIASQTSLVRPYIRDLELKRAKERGVEIGVVRLEPCASHEDTFLRKYQLLAPRLKSVAQTSPRSVAWEEVRKDLVPLIQRVRERKRH